MLQRQIDGVGELSRMRGGERDVVPIRRRSAIRTVRCSVRRCRSAGGIEVFDRRDSLLIRDTLTLKVCFRGLENGIIHAKAILCLHLVQPAADLLAGYLSVFFCAAFAGNLICDSKRSKLLLTKISMAGLRASRTPSS